MLILKKICSLQKECSHEVLRILGIKFKFHTKKIDNFFFFVLTNIFVLIQKCYKQKDYIFVDNLYEVHCSCIDTYSIFTKIKNSKYLIYKNNLQYEEIGHNKNIIAFDFPGTPDASSFSFFVKLFFPLLKCKYFVSSFYGSLPTNLRNFILHNSRIKLIGTGHGPVMLKKLVFDFPFCNSNEWDGYIVTNDYERELFLQNGWETSKLIKCSLPRYDLIKKTNKRVRKIFIMFTWRLSFEHKPNSIYSSLFLKKLNELLNNKNLLDKLNANNIKLTLGLHHALLDIIKFKPEFNINIADTNHLIDEINSADLFITDYSSIFFDFAFRNVPIIFYRLDSQDFNLLDIDRNDIDNAKSYDDVLYNICYSLEEVIDKISHYINNNFQLEDDIINKNKKLFYNKKDCISTFIDEVQKRYE